MHPALKNALLEWRGQSLYATETDFVFPSVRNKGREPLDLRALEQAAQALEDFLTQPRQLKE